jgi:NAD+ kinase
MRLPAIRVTGRDPGGAAINDISLHRGHDGRVAQLAYAIGDAEIGRVRCDGLVVSTPAGSTGYNLANGGPVLAWGVEGFVVSFIAPHSMTARALVVAPDDPLTLRNVSRDETVEVMVDGRPTCELAAGDALELRFVADQGHLAQVPGASFYHRLREKFGRLAS